MKEGNKEKSVALKTSSNDVTEEQDKMSYVTRRFQKIIKKHKVFQKKGPNSKKQMQIIFVINVENLVILCGSVQVRSRKLKTSNLKEGTMS